MIDHYAVNKFIYDTDRNQEFVRRYIEDPAEYVDWYFSERITRLLENESETSAVQVPDDRTREAFKNYDFEFFYQHGAHPFLLWTLMLPVLEAKLDAGEFVLDMSTVPEGVRAENKKPMAYYRAKIEKHGRPYYGY